MTVSARNFLLVLFFLFSFVPFFYGQERIMDARSAGMGGIGICSRNLWALYSNQASLAFLEKPEIGIHYNNRFLIHDLSTRAFCAAFPSSFGVFGASYAAYGNSLLNKTETGLAYSRRLGKIITSGLRFNYHRIHQADIYGNSHDLSVEGGMMAVLSPEFTVAAYVFNPWSGFFQPADAENLVPSRLLLGMAWEISPSSLILMETEKDVTAQPVFRFGIEQGWLSTYFLRAGIASNPALLNAGLGYKLNHVRIDLAFASHQLLGYSPYFSLQYAFH